MQARRRILLRIATCPYCRRAEAALDQSGVPYDKIDIDPRDRTLVELLSGQPSVPVLLEVIGGDDQDDDIIEYLKDCDDHRNQS